MGERMQTKLPLGQIDVSIRGKRGSLGSFEMGERKRMPLGRIDVFMGGERGSAGLEEGVTSVLLGF